MRVVVRTMAGRRRPARDPLRRKSTQTKSSFRQSITKLFTARRSSQGDVPCPASCRRSALRRVAALRLADDRTGRASISTRVPSVSPAAPRRPWGREGRGCCPIRELHADPMAISVYQNDIQKWLDFQATASEPRSHGNRRSCGRSSDPASRLDIFHQQRAGAVFGIRQGPSTAPA